MSNTTCVGVPRRDEEIGKCQGILQCLENGHCVIFSDRKNICPVRKLFPIDSQPEVHPLNKHQPPFHSHYTGQPALTGASS